MAGLNFNFDPDVLQPLIEAVVTATVARLEADRAKLDGKIAYSEPEAARLLDLEVHVLRDERLRGKIAASSIVGRRIRYLKQDLVNYLLTRRWGAS